MLLALAMLQSFQSLVRGAAPTTSAHNLDETRVLRARRADSDTVTASFNVPAGGTENAAEKRHRRAEAEYTIERLSSDTKCAEDSTRLFIERNVESYTDCAEHCLGHAGCNFFSWAAKHPHGQLFCMGCTSKSNSAGDAGFVFYRLDRAATTAATTTTTTTTATTAKDVVQFTASASFTVPAGRTENAAEEAKEGLGSVWVQESTDLEFLYDGGSRGVQTVLTTFPGVTIPKGAKIKNAFVEFIVDKLQSNNPITVEIAAEAGPASVPIDKSFKDVSKRTQTKARVSWAIPKATGIGQKIPTVNIASLVEEAVADDDWTSGSRIGFIYTHSSGTGLRTFTKGMRLFVEWTTAVSSQADVKFTGFQYQAFSPSSGKLASPGGVGGDWRRTARSTLAITNTPGTGVQCSPGIDQKGDDKKNTAYFAFGLTVLLDDGTHYPVYNKVDNTHFSFPIGPNFGGSKVNVENEKHHPFGRDEKWDVGDTGAVLVNAKGQIEYYHNSKLLYTSTYTPTFPLYAFATVHNAGDSITCKMITTNRFTFDSRRDGLPGKDQTWTVPTGITEVTVKLWGAGGAGESLQEKHAQSHHGFGGGGGFVSGTMKVKPGDTYTIVVGDPGRKGNDKSRSGIEPYGFGGSGKCPGGGGCYIYHLLERGKLCITSPWEDKNRGREIGDGGGLSGIFLGTKASKETAVVVAGGGGGGSDSAFGGPARKSGTTEGCTGTLQGASGGGARTGGGGGGYCGGTAKSQYTVFGGINYVEGLSAVTHDLGGSFLRI